MYVGIRNIHVNFRCKKTGYKKLLFYATTDYTLLFGKSVVAGA